eukprot:g5354.t1
MAFALEADERVFAAGAEVRTAEAMLAEASAVDAPGAQEEERVQARALAESECDVKRDAHAAALTDAAGAAAAASAAAATAAAEGVFCLVTPKNGPFELDARTARLPARENSAEAAAAAQAAAQAAAAGMPPPVALAAPAPSSSPTFMDLWAPQVAAQVRVPALGLTLAFELRKGSGWGEGGADARAKKGQDDVKGEDKGDDEDERKPGDEGKGEAKDSVDGAAGAAVAAAEPKDGGERTTDETGPATGATRGEFRLFGRCVSCPDGRMLTLALAGAPEQLSISSGEAFGFPETRLALPLPDGMATDGDALETVADAEGGDAKIDAAAEGGAAAAVGPSPTPFELQIKCGHVSVTLGLEEIWAEEYIADADAAPRSVTKHVIKGQTKGLEEAEMSMVLFNPSAQDVLQADAIVAGAAEVPTKPGPGEPIVTIGDTSP